MPEIDEKYLKSENYVNREMSWLEFDFRILGEARDKAIPLFERLKFLSITSSNLDEFFMVRVASLKDMVHAKYKKTDIAGLRADQQLELIGGKTHELVNLQYSTYNRSLLPALKQQGLQLICEHEELSEADGAFVDKFFHEDVYPVLTPMAVDSSRPFPLIRNKSLNIAALVQKKDSRDEELEFAMVQVPSVLPRIVELPAGPDGERRVILLEEVIERNIKDLFLNYNIVAAHPFRIMRNADFTLDEEEAEDLLEEIQKQLKKRQWGEVIRLEVEEKVDKRLLKILKRELSVSTEDIYEISGPLDLTFLMKMYGMSGFDHLKEPSYTPQPVPAFMNEDDIFTNIRKGDILLHHPFGLCHMPRIPLKIHPVSSFYLPSSPKRSFGERINHTFPSISERFTFPISAIRLSSLLSRLSPRTKYSSPPRTIFSLAIPASAIAVVSYFSFSFLLLI